MSFFWGCVGLVLAQFFMRLYCMVQCAFIICLLYGVSYIFVAFCERLRSFCVTRKGATCIMLFHELFTWMCVLILAVLLVGNDILRFSRKKHFPCFFDVCFT